LSRSREDVAVAARREVREEVGVDVILVGEPAVVVDPGERRVDVVYAARLVPGIDRTAARPVSPEIIECRWFDAATIDSLPLQREAAEALEALRRLRS
jgi:ADP-ribose pyrophosphatase YjhB (NUDIX family)